LENIALIPFGEHRLVGLEELCAGLDRAELVPHLFQAPPESIAARFDRFVLPAVDVLRFLDPVELLRISGSEGRHRRYGDDTAGKPRRAGKGGTAAAGAADDVEPLHPEAVGYRDDVDCAIRVGAAGPAPRALIAGPGDGHVTQA
jgi:hypothetical protein